MAPGTIVDLLETYVGQPALVIGGGPSARLDLPKLDEAGFKPGIVISANEHGFHQGHYKVDFIVNVDKIHCARRIHMEEYLRPYGVPIINQHSWADYRLVGWKFAANSGVTAVAVACMLGAWPVVVTGIDLFGTGRVYFHDADQRNKIPRPKTGPPSHYAKQRMKELANWSRNYPIRPVSGPLKEFFPLWTPEETFERPKAVPYRLEAINQTIRSYKAVHGHTFRPNDTLNAGEVVQLSQAEARPGLDKGWLVAV
jgi:hypothetical protein